MIMNIAKAPGEILEALKEHERVIAQLYEVYARKFPEYEDLWSQLSGEEIQHAEWLEQLQVRVEGSEEDFVMERFAIGAVKHSIVYVNGLIDSAADPDFLLMNALSTAMYLETALIENKYFEVFEADSPGTKHALEMLAQSTQEHCQRLRKVREELA
jgi:hypothetical protein